MEGQDGLLEHVYKVLEILRNCGLHKSQEVFISEIQDKFPELFRPRLSGSPETATSGSEENFLDPESNAEDFVATDGWKEPVAPTESPAKVSLQRQGSQPLAPEVFVDELRRTRSLSEIDEYEGADDVGYYRQTVIDERQFVASELDLRSEAGSEHAQPQTPQDLCSPVSDSSGSSATLSSLDFGSPAAQVSTAVDQSGSPVKDETWDLGPVDIKIADPVRTPTKDSIGTAADQRPCLSRVESLSNSFIEEQDSCDGNLSNRQSEAGSLDPEIMEFVPTADPQTSRSQELESFLHFVSGPDPSRTSSIDVLPDLSTRSEISDVDRTDTPAGKGLTVQTVVNSGGETPVVGGFSFPVTPPSEEPDQQIFTSWPSIRSRPDSSPARSADGPKKADKTIDHAFENEPTSASEWPATEPQDATAGQPTAQVLTRSRSQGGTNLAGQLEGLTLDDARGTLPHALVADAGGSVDEADASSKSQAEASAPCDSSHADEEADLPALPSFPSGPAADPQAGVHLPRYTVDESGNILYEFDEEYIRRKYEIFELRVVHRRRRTGFEESKDFPIRINDLIAGRYQVMEFLGSAAFSRAVQALDLKTQSLVCLKIIKNNKDYYDQSLDEIKLLKFVNAEDPNDEHGIVRLYDFFYYKEHLFLVCELLRANLYEFQKYNKESGDEPYFILPRIQRIAIQTLQSLAFLHHLGLIHSDLKPENILIKSYSRCEVKVIDLGSSCFTTDHLSSYVQSRSYRAPEVILGLDYDQKIDVWSLGCILAELSSGSVLFQNDSLATLLARLEGILGPIPSWMVAQGRYGHRFYTKNGQIYERSPHTGAYELLLPKRTSLKWRVPDADDGFIDFIAFLLTVDPRQRPTAEVALQHPWLQYNYPPIEPVQD